MTLQKLASLIAKREGKKSQARIGDIREILKLIVTFEMNALEANDISQSPLAALAIGVLKRTKGDAYSLTMLVVKPKKKKANAVSRRRRR